ncbi:NAD(P)H-binding protein [Dactylosporangium salmoneum]
MSSAGMTLVTGAGGGTGGVGRTAVELLRGRDLPVRALVHHDDERAGPLRAAGAEVVVGDLTSGADVVRAMDGCRRVYFGMSVSPSYLQAAAVVGAAGRAAGDLELLVNMSQMTVSQMSLTSTGESAQQHLHWLGEQILDWSGLPVAHVRPTVFLENPLFRILALGTIRRDGTIRLPFGSERTSPVAAEDVAAVVAALLTEGRKPDVYELTGRRAQRMDEMAAELTKTLGRPVRYVDVAYDEWVRHDLEPLGLPAHVEQHVATMARLHAEGRYNRETDTVERLLGRPPATAGDVFSDWLDAPRGS